MGICSSTESTSMSTAKLILENGQLQEFSSPIKVSQVLQKNPSCFICNSDEMEFDDFVSAINGDEDLQLGQLYFALPFCRLRNPIKAEEIAELAVMASSALMRTGDKCGCRRKVVVPVVYSVRKEVKSLRRDGKVGFVEKRKGRGRSGGKGRNFTSELSVIPEFGPDNGS